MSAVIRFVHLPILALLAAYLVVIPVSASSLTQPQHRNYVLNGDFEAGIASWTWHVANGAAAAESINLSDSHSGQACLVLSNKSEFAPNVYGSMQQLITGLKPNTNYELSAWVKSRNADNCWLGGGPDWGVRLPLPVNSAVWTRVSTVFKTGPQDTSWLTLLNTDGVTGSLEVDDIAVTDPSTVAAFLFPPSLHKSSETDRDGLAIAPGKYAVSSYDVTEDISGAITVAGPALSSSGVLILRYVSEAGNSQDLASCVLEARQPGTKQIVQFDIPASLLPSGRGTIDAQLDTDKSPFASHEIVRKDLADIITGELTAVEQRYSFVKRLAASKRLSGNGYVRLGLSVAERYIIRVKTGGPTGNQWPYWSNLQIRETDEVLTATERLIDNPEPTTAIPEGKPVINNDVLSTNGRPVFYGGYGAWDQAVADIPNFPALGASIIQQETGPIAIASDGSFSLAKQSGMFDNAAAHGIKISFLLSPHYFPDWARSEAPDVTIPNEGFITYNIDHPVARKVIENWLTVASKTFGQKPALLSFCLSNEPGYEWSGRDSYSKPLWIDYLAGTHGSIENLNSLYGTSYASFNQVPVPQPTVPTLDQTDGVLCAYFDWMNFNNQHFAAWHSWMNNIIKRSAPNAYTDIKIMAAGAFDRGSMRIGVDPELFCHITDFAGNDDYMFPDPDGKYACNWQVEESSYDLIRSFQHQPSINSENHLIPDRSTEPVSMAYARAVMWQGALHGQAATVTWVWGEAGQPSDDLYGSIYYRPADVFGVGRAWLDAQRLSPQVAAIIRQPAHVAILYSRTSLYWQQSYADALRSAYTALDFSGEPVTFVTEDELSKGNFNGVKIIILPLATHVSDAAVSALERFVASGGKVVALGTGNLMKDQYDRPRTLPEGLRMIDIPFVDDDQATEIQIIPLLKSSGCYVPLIDRPTEKQTFGIEYRLIKCGGKSYLSAINFLSSPQTISTSALGGHKVVDLLSGQTLNASNIEMPPLVPRMLTSSKQ